MRQLNSKPNPSGPSPQTENKHENYGYAANKSQVFICSYKQARKSLHHCVQALPIRNHYTENCP